MRVRRTPPILFLAAGLALTFLPAPPAAAARQDRGAASSEVDRELAETLQELLVLRFRKTLELTEEQEDQVVPLMQELTRLRRENARRRIEATRTLFVMSQDSGADENLLRQRLNDFYRDQEQFQRDQERLSGEIRSHLDPRQQARLLGLEERFRREVRDRVAGARRMRPIGDRRHPRPNRRPTGDRRSPRPDRQPPRE